MIIKKKGVTQWGDKGLFIMNKHYDFTKILVDGDKIEMDTKEIDAGGEWDGDITYKPVSILGMVNGSYTHKIEVIEQLQGYKELFEASNGSGFFEVTMLDGYKKLFNPNFISTIDNSCLLATARIKYEDGKVEEFNYLVRSDATISLEAPNPSAILPFNVIE